MTRIAWIRHGRTEWNELGKIQGMTDIALSEAGKMQVLQLAKRLETDHAWQAIYCSDLSRAKETAEILSHALEIESMSMDVRLRERAMGRLEGLTLEERIERWGKQWRDFEHGLETDDSLLERGKQFVEDIILQKHERVLVVSHGGFIGFFLRFLCPELKREHLGNTSVTITEYSNENWICPLYNCTAHL